MRIARMSWRRSAAFALLFILIVPVLVACGGAVPAAAPTATPAPAPAASDAPEAIAVFILLRFLEAAIGGLIIGLVLRRTELSLGWEGILIISIGWAMSAFIVRLVGFYFYGGITGSISGAIFGALGGAVMFWQISWARGRS